MKINLIISHHKLGETAGKLYVKSYNWVDVLNI